jgi:oligosaccharide repeat unit polymerase
VSPTQIFVIFLIATIFGFFPMLLSVDFDFMEMVRQMSLPRFAQSWQRGRFGDLYAILWELGALLYLVPPIAGLVFARTKEYSVLQKGIVTLVLLFTIYYGFSSGTRNILAVYTISFFGAYYLNKADIKFVRVAVQGTAIVAILLVATAYMLEFRNSGMDNFSFSESSPDRIYIDQNLVVLSQVADAFSRNLEFLGIELPFYALVHPIPRALWPGKPEGLSISVESIVGVDQSTTTIACTFIGEAYMMGGVLGVLITALAFGAGAGMWNRVGYNVNSPYSQLLYASGFFCAAISMRSMQWTTVTMLPTLALWTFSRVWPGTRRSRPNLEHPKQR